jgi:hypothetical protein
VSFSGNILTMPFADLLQWVAQSRKTGTLVVKGPDHTKKIYFSGGLVVAAASENPREFLSYYLVGWQYIAEDELQELLQMQNRHGTLLGELLVIIGRISRDELAYVLEVKTENAVYDIFLWQEGEFRFLENILPDKKFQPTEIPIDMLILEGIRRKDEWTRMAEVVTDGSWIPRLLRAVDLKDMEEPDLSIIREINGSRSLEEIALASRLGVYTVVEYVVQGIEAGVFAAEPPEAERSEIPGYSASAWKLVLGKAKELLDVDELRASYDQLRKLRSQFPSDQEVLNQVAAVEAHIRDSLSAKGINGKAILELAISMSELTSITCSPEEGFLLSRVNGTYPIDELCMMMPGAEIEVYLLVDAMLNREVLRFKDG